MIKFLILEIHLFSEFKKEKILQNLLLRYLVVTKFYQIENLV